MCRNRKKNKKDNTDRKISLFLIFFLGVFLFVLSTSCVVWHTELLGNLQTSRPKQDTSRLISLVGK